MQKNPPVYFRKVSKPKSLRSILEMLMSTCVYNGKFNSFVPPQPPVSFGQLLAQTLASCCSVNTAGAITRLPTWLHGNVIFFLSAAAFPTLVFSQGFCSSVLPLTWYRPGWFLISQMICPCLACLSSHLRTPPLLSLTAEPLAESSSGSSSRPPVRTCG